MSGVTLFFWQLARTHRLDEQAANYVLFFGLCSSMLLAVLIINLNNSREKALEMVAKATQELESHNLQLQTEIQRRSASEGELQEKTRHLNRALSLQHALINNILDMAWVKDRDLKFVLCNEPFAQSANSKPEELVGKTDFDYWPPDLAAKYVEDDKQVMASARRQQVEEELVQKDGKSLWIDTVKTPIFDEITGEVIGTVGIARDITAHRFATRALEEAYTSLQQEIAERKTVEKQLLQSQKMQAIGTLTGGIAHDFNNILWMILGNSEMLATELEKNDLCLEMAQDISHAAERGKGLVQQLLDFSRNSEFEKVHFSPTPLLKETLKLLRSTIPSRVDLIQETLSYPFEIYGDPNKFHQIMMNLLTNAYHAIVDKGSITVKMDEISISVDDVDKGDLKKPGHFLFVEVADTGSGMSTETIERIFDPFFTTKEVGKGTGLGLSTVLGIVEEMDGFIGVRSEVGTGSIFKVYFPIESADNLSPELMEASAGSVAET